MGGAAARVGDSSHAGGNYTFVLKGGRGNKGLGRRKRKWQIPTNPWFLTLYWSYREPQLCILLNSYEAPLRIEGIIRPCGSMGCCRYSGGTVSTWPPGRWQVAVCCAACQRAGDMAGVPQPRPLLLLAWSLSDPAARSPCFAACIEGEGRTALLNCPECTE